MFPTNVPTETTIPVHASQKPTETRSQAARRLKRAGAHTVEFAIVLPLLVLMLTGSVEMARLNMIRNTAQNAAYEGARRGALPGAKTSAAKTAAQQVLAAVGVKNANITVTPTVITDHVPRVTVAVSIPMNGNAWITPLFARDRSIAANCTLTRELVLP